MQTGWSSDDLLKAERIPPRRIGDFLLRARKGLPVALAGFCLIAVGCVAASFLFPGEYRSSAALLLMPDNADPSQPAPDAATRSAAVDKGVGMLNAPEIAAQVLATLQQDAPQAAKPGAAAPGPIIQARRRGESYVIDVVATASSPLAAKTVAETAIELFRGRRADEQIALAANTQRPSALTSNRDIRNLEAALPPLEAERASLRQAAGETAPATTVSDAARRTASDLAKARAQAAAMKALLRSEVTVTDVQNFRASGTIDSLGDTGPAFAADLASYEAALEAGKSDPAKADDAKYKKYKILTAASQLEPVLDARAAHLAAAAAPKSPTQSLASIARIAELDKQIDAQRKLIAAARAAESAPLARQPADLAAPTGAAPINVRVLSRPEAGVAAWWRQPLILYPAAFGAGFLLAILYLGFVVFASNTVMDPRDAAALAGAPLLAVVPRLTPTQLRELPPGERHPANYPIEVPASSFADSMRAALVRLRPPKGEPTTCVAVAGAQVGDGASTVSLAFARTAAVAGVRVLLIDTDFADAGLTRAMGIEPSAGIEAILGGHRQLADLVVEDPLTSVHLLPSAPSEASRGALSLTQLTALKNMLAGARGSYDMIVIDCQPHSTRARTRSMARLADKVLIVAAYDITKRNVMSAFARRMEHNRVGVCGVVFNFVPDRSRRERFHFLPDRAEAVEAPHFAAMESTTVPEIRSIH